MVSGEKEKEYVKVHVQRPWKGSENVRRNRRQNLHRLVNIRPSLGQLRREM